MSQNRSRSRLSRHHKRRTNKRNLLFFSTLGVFFIIILFSLIVFGNRDKPDEQVTSENDPEEIHLHDKQDENDENKTGVDENNSTNEDDMNEEQSQDENLMEIDDIDVQQVDSSDDNVIVAYKGNWPPIGTAQEGPHTTNYSEGSDDRIEIKRAVSIVTGIEDDDMIEHWVGNNGDQKVTATVESKKSNEVFKVYLSWIDQEGWQVTRVEKMKENQKQ